MSFFLCGRANRLWLAALLILAAPLFAQSAPLGDVARQARAERQQSGAHPKVWTNEDLGGAAPAKPASDGNKGKDTKDAKLESADANTGSEAAKKAPDGSAANPASSKAAAESGPEAKEAELQKRSKEVNQQYLDKISAVRAQIATVQQEVGRLQRDQMESNNQFRSSNGTGPSVNEYESQQRLFQQQIEEQNKLLVNLNQELDDAKEAARHAGVPHANED